MMRNYFKAFSSSCGLFSVVLTVLTAAPPGTVSAQIPARLQILEGESLVARSRIGQVSVQSMRMHGDGWSGNAQLLWDGGSPGAMLDIEFEVLQPAVYALELYFTRAPDYGQIAFALDGQLLNATLDIYSPELTRPVPYQAGTHALTAGPHRLSIKIDDKSPYSHSEGYRVGLDQMKLYPTAALAVEATEARMGPPPDNAGTARSTRTATDRIQPDDRSLEPLDPSGDEHSSRVIGDPVTGGDPAASSVGTGTVVAASASSVVLPDAPTFNPDMPLFPATKLAFGTAVPDTKKPAWGGTEKIFDKDTAQTPLIWQTPTAGAGQWHWQMATQPFPAEATTPPSGLLAEGDANYDYFTLNLANYLSGAESAATDFYIRVIALQNGQPSGILSNTVVAHFQPGSAQKNQAIFAALGQAEAAKKQAQDQLAQANNVFAISILGFQPAIFPDPNRWGCVKVISNPYAGKKESSQVGNSTTDIYHPLAYYYPGEYCPKPDPQYQQKGVWEKYVEGSIEGWMLGWNQLAGYYNDAKAWAASQIADAVPCDWLGKELEQSCKDAAEQLASAAISAGLAVAGLPPSIPDLDALSEIGKGQIANGATEFSCQVFESNGGTCTPEMRKQLQAAFKKGLDELQKQVATNLKHEAHEPGCGDTQTAKEHGLVALPCFSDYPGVVVQPAIGSVYAPPEVKVRVTRKLPQPPAIQDCNRVAVEMKLTNSFKGGYLGGKNLPAAPVSGTPYKPVSMVVPALVVGQSIELLTVLAEMNPVQVPGNYVSNFYLPNWLVLYRGGQGSLNASMLASVQTGTAAGKIYGSCAADSMPVLIPQ